MSKNDMDSADQISISVDKDKLLTYILTGLIIATVVFGYSMIGSKNQASAKGDSSQSSGDDMASHHGGGGNKKFTPLSPGSDAPDFSLASTTGQTIAMSDYKGRNILLFFNEGVMCSPCWQEISRLERFKDDFAKLNTVIVPVSVDDQATWSPILKEERITTPILMDPNRNVTKAYKALGTPSSMHDDRAGHTYVHIDPQGKIHASSDFPNMNVPTNVLLEHIKQYIDGNSQG